MDQDKRSANFTTAEENDLLNVVTKYKHIVECKKTDSLSNTQKNTIWITIAKDYNASAATTRSATAVKTKYKNMKKRSKQKFADERSNVKSTGGGPAKVVQVDSTDVQILELLGQRMTGRVSEFDQDRSMHTNNDTIIDTNINSQVQVQMMETDEEAFMREIESNTEGDVVLPIENSDLPSANWSGYTPAQLKTPVSTPLKTNARSNSKMTSKMCDWVQSKLNVNDIDVKLKLERHEQQMLHSKEEHELKMLHMQEQNAKDLEIKNEQHGIQMEILKLQILHFKK